MYVEEIPYYKNGQMKKFWIEKNNIYTAYYVSPKKTKTNIEVNTKENFELIKKEYLNTLNEYLNKSVVNYNIISDKYDEVRNTRKGICRLMVLVGLILLIIPCIGSFINNMLLVYTGMIFTPAGALVLYVGSDSLREYRDISSEYDKYNRLKDLSSILKRQNEKNSNPKKYCEPNIQYNRYNKFDRIKKRIRKK